MKSISVALCADKNIQVGLHVTLYSLLESQTHPVKINFFQNGYHEEDIARIHETLKPFEGNYELNVVALDDQEFRGYRGLQGNTFTYVRLLIANYLEENRVIYLDSDLLIKKDLAPMFFEELNGFVIGVTTAGTIGTSLECEFYTSLGLSKEAPYFNAGVMLIDLEKWRAQDTTKTSIAFASKYPNKLLTADQTVLNYLFYEKFQPLDPSYNHPLYPNNKPVSAETTDRIFHFVGSPKPWDLFGEMVHKNHPMFASVLRKTAFKNYKTYTDLSFQRVKRMFRLSRSYFKSLTS